MSDRTRAYFSRYLYSEQLPLKFLKMMQWVTVAENHGLSLPWRKAHDPHRTGDALEERQQGSLLASHLGGWEPRTHMASLMPSEARDEA